MAMKSPCRGSFVIETEIDRDTADDAMTASMALVAITGLSFCVPTLGTYYTILLL